MSGRNLINMDTSTTNVYLNRDPIEATLPVQAIQPTVNDPITISLKGLSPGMYKVSEKDSRLTGSLS